MQNEKKNQGAKAPEAIVLVPAPGRKVVIRPYNFTYLQKRKAGRKWSYMHEHLGSRRLQGNSARCAIVLPIKRRK